MLNESVVQVEDFLPVALGESECTSVRLADLPPNKKLISPEPTPAFVHSIETYGVLCAIILIRKDGVLDILGGRRRVKAARACGLETIPATILAEGYCASAVVSIIENYARTPNEAQTFIDLQYLLSSGLDRKQITEATGINPSTYNKIMSLEQLPSELWTAFVQGKIAASTAYKAAKLTPEQQMQAVELYQEVGTLRVSDCQEMRRVKIKTAANELPDRLFAPVGDIAPVNSVSAPIKTVKMDRVRAIAKEYTDGKSRVVQIAIQEFLNRINDIP